MGSFLISCCATNQSISSEEVYVIPIFENIQQLKNEKGLPLQGLDRLTYNTDLYGLLGFIFTGSYYDYGQYEIDWTKPSNKYMLEQYLDFLKEKAVYIEQGENQYHDPAFNPVDLKVDGTNYQEIWEYIHEVIWEGRLFLCKQNYQGGYLYTKVEYFVAHKENMDILLDMYQKRDVSRGYYSSDDVKEFYSKTIEEKALFMFDQYKTELEEEGNHENSLILLQKRLNRSDRIQHFLGESYGNGANVLWRPYEQVRKELVEKHLDNYEDYLDIYKAFVAMKDIVVSLMFCNIVIRPVYYASQDYGNSFGLCFGHWMEQIHKRNIENDNFENYYEDNDIDEDVVLSPEQVKDIIKKDAESFIY